MPMGIYRVIKRRKRRSKADSSTTGVSSTSRVGLPPAAVVTTGGAVVNTAPVATPARQELVCLPSNDIVARIVATSPWQLARLDNVVPERRISATKYHKVSRRFGAARVTRASQTDIDGANHTVGETVSTTKTVVATADASSQTEYGQAYPDGHRSSRHKTRGEYGRNATVD